MYVKIKPMLKVEYNYITSNNLRKFLKISNLTKELRKIYTLYSTYTVPMKTKNFLICNTNITSCSIIRT